ncbi:MAG: hypothetical protein JRJ29_00835 [Deltaproteobacteria bacterium]|nr:hypothetical protein [Deltaproteobacteria bacterium]
MTILHEAGIRWWKAFIYSVVTTALLYIGMVNLLKVDLWTGAIPEIIPGFLGGSLVPPI